ncbi:hypothetical protein [Streptomyces sp. NPDC059862]
MRIDEFDYVVVGGGTAGNVVAARFPENPKRIWSRRMTRPAA